MKGRFTYWSLHMSWFKITALQRRIQRQISWGKRPFAVHPQKIYFPYVSCSLDRGCPCAPRSPMNRSNRPRQQTRELKHPIAGRPAKGFMLLPCEFHIFMFHDSKGVLVRDIDMVGMVRFHCIPSKGGRRCSRGQT